MFIQNTSPQDTTWSPLGWPKLKRLFKPRVERTWISQNSPMTFDFHIIFLDHKILVFLIFFNHLKM